MADIRTAELTEGTALSPEELAAIPAFAGIRKEIWSKFPGAIVKRTFQPGQIIMRQGDSGNTAFYILAGEIEVFLERAPTVPRSWRAGKKGSFKGMMKLPQYLMGIPDRGEPAAAERTHIDTDTSVPIEIEHNLATLKAGDMIGELAALAVLRQERLKRPKFYPRSATARAKRAESPVAETPVEVLEMLPHILNNVLYNSPAFKELLSQNYNERALATHLRTVPVFRPITDEFLAALRGRVKLLDYPPDTVIVREGDAASAFYLIRLGFVKVARNFAGGEQVLTYLSRGSYFGEMGVLPPAFPVRAQGTEPGQIAEGMVSGQPLVCGRSPSGDRCLKVPWDTYISKNHFQMQVEGDKLRVSRLPSGLNPLKFNDKPAESFLVSAGQSFVAGSTTFHVLPDPLQSGKRTATCTAMDYVQLVEIKRDDFASILQQFPEVAAEITEVARARRQADAQALNRVQTISVDDFMNQELMQGQDLLLLDLDRCTRCDECVKACVTTHPDHIPRLIRDGLRFDHYLVPTSCRACMDPLCMTRCPVGSIRRKGSLDIVIEDWCIGCCNCAQDCPYGNINVVLLPETDTRKAQAEHPKAVVCDLCVEYDEPNCVRACPHDAAIRVDARRFFARDLAGVQLAVPTGAPAAAPADLPPAAVPTEPLADMETQIYSNAAELLAMLPQLCIQKGPRAGAILQLRFPATTFGRAPENDWQFRDDQQMSRAHAIIECRDQSYILRDLNSTNGTTVNGEPVTGEVELRNADVIRIGELEAEFSSGTMS